MPTYWRATCPPTAMVVRCYSRTPSNVIRAEILLMLTREEWCYKVGRPVNLCAAAWSLAEMHEL